MAEQIPETANKGLEGVVAFTSEISAIVGATLSYRGYTIEDLAEHSNFEEVAFLLWNNRLPAEPEYQDWRKNLGANYDLPPEIIVAMKGFPKNATPMEVLRSSVSLLSLWDPDSQNDSPEALQRKAVRILAKMPALVCAWHRVRTNQEFIKADPQKTIAQNFFYMLTGKDADSRVTEMFDTALVLHADHEMNASTFSARVTTATLSDVHSAITTAVGTLKGPLHGGANEQVMKMLEQIGGTAKCEPWLRGALERKDKVMGFGHRVYKNGDPRAKILRQMSKEITARVGKPELYEMSVIINDIMEGEKGLLPNVDFYSASDYHCMGIPTDLFTPVFAVSRISGWLSHVMEQMKGNRLIRPRSIYTGKLDQFWKPFPQR